MGDLLLCLVNDCTRVGVDEDVSPLGLESLVEVALVVELGVGRHAGFALRVLLVAEEEVLLYSKLEKFLGRE